MESSVPSRMRNSITRKNWYKSEKRLMRKTTINMAINIVIFVQLLSVALALEEITYPTLKPTSNITEKIEDPQVPIDQSEFSKLSNSTDVPLVTEPTPSSFRKHSHRLPTKIKLTGPLDLRVNTTTPNSITLTWRLNPEMKGKIIYYRVYYVHENYRDVKTIKLGRDGRYELTGLDPFTMYNISIEGITEGDVTTPRSNEILAHTDIDKPGSPTITNLTCMDEGKLYVEWQRPEKYGSHVDTYKIFYGPSNDPAKLQFKTVKANPGDAKSKFVIYNLEGDTDYEVTVSASTKSLSNPPLTHDGEISDKARVYLPMKSCDDNRVFGQELSAGMIGGAICAVLFLMLAIIGFIVWRQYFKAAYYYLDEPHRTIGPTGCNNMPNWEEEPGPDGSHSGAISLEDFPEHVAKLHEDSDFGFSKEYDEIQRYCSKTLKATHEHSSHIDNKCKNRYLNIVAYDHCRVKLAPIAGQKKTSDYINANYIDGFKKCNAYIGTQGPLEDTREAFWRMVWEQNVYVIVMITNLVERGRRKCDIYWPKEDTEEYGQIEAQLESEEIMADYTIRTIRIRHLKECGEKVTNVSTLKKKKNFINERIIKQFHYTSWPDHGVPCHPLPVLTFVRKSSEANPKSTSAQGNQGDSITNGAGCAGESNLGTMNGNSLNSETGGPIVVHCSAGVGRTGTYIVIDAMLQQMRMSGKLNVYGFLKHIRTQRNYLVQTEEQYVFTYDVLLEALKSGETEIHRDYFSQYVYELMFPPSKKNQNGYENISNSADPEIDLNDKSNIDEIPKEAENKDDIDKLSNAIQHSNDSIVDNSSRSILSTQFELITSVKPSAYQYLSANKDYNKSKNRDSSLIPIESHRIALAPKPGIEGSDYINASWLNGHNKLKEFIVTQHPTTDTKEDFWRMLWDHNAQTVVLLSTCDSEDLPIFWPNKNEGFDFETFRVRFVEEAIHEGHTTFDLVVSSQHDDYELAVRIIHCPEWHKMHNLIQAFKVLKLVQDWHLEYQDGPLVVVDRCGGTEAATFCALTTLCKQLDSYNSMDIYQVSKLYHNKRPGIWKSPDDIMYLYKALETLIASKDISNPLQESAAIEGNYPVSDYPTLITDFPVTASSSEGGATATTIEMVVGEKGDIHDSSDSAFNSKPDQRISESVSVSSTAATEMCHADLIDSDDRRKSPISFNDESQLKNGIESALNCLPPPEQKDTSNLLIDSVVKSPSNSNKAASPEPTIPSALSPVDANTLVNMGDTNNITTSNGCAIAIQVDEDYDEEENEDEISETVALTQKFDKSRIKKN